MLGVGGRREPVLCGWCPYWSAVVGRSWCSSGSVWASLGGSGHGVQVDGERVGVGQVGVGVGRRTGRCAKCTARKVVGLGVGLGVRWAGRLGGAIMSGRRVGKGNVSGREKVGVPEEGRTMCNRGIV